MLQLTFAQTSPAATADLSHSGVCFSEKVLESDDVFIKRAHANNACNLVLIDLH